MRAVDSETVFDRTAWVVVRPQKESYLLYSSRTDEMHLVPPSGFAIYQLCDGLRTVADIGAHMSDAFDAEHSALRRHLSRFLGDLESRGLVERVDA